MPIFHYSLKPGGILFLGNAESVSGFGDLFAPLGHKERIYRRIDTGARLQALEFPTKTWPSKSNALDDQEKPAAPAVNFQSLADQLLLRRFSPASARPRNWRPARRKRRCVMESTVPGRKRLFITPSSCPKVDLRFARSRSGKRTLMPAKQPRGQPTSLRRRAEERMAKGGKTAASESGGESRRLVQELEVHQVELELQNEELRQARQELEANYNELYDFAPVGYFTLGQYGDIEKANLTGSEMLGQPRPQLLGRRFASFISPDSLSSFDDFLRRVTRGYEKESCAVTLTKGGHTPVAAYIEATGAGPNSHFRAVVVDITSAEQARRELRESEERLRLALAASGMGVWEWERDTGDIYWSPECFKIFGVDHFCPTLDILAQLMHPEDAPRVRTVLRQALADGKEQSVKCRIIRPSGEVVWIFASAHVQFDKLGKPVRLVGIAQNITDRV